MCTNSLIVSLLYKSTPDEVRFIMVDPKMVELAPYNGIPHLLIPVVTDPKKAAGALQWAVFEMMKRYKTFSEHGVKKLEEFNRLARASEDLETLPSVVVALTSWPTLCWWQLRRWRSPSAGWPRWAAPPASIW